MKKIFYTAILILLAGLFIGCASTSANNGATKNVKTKKVSSEKEVFAEIYSLLEKPVITKEDIDYMWHLPFGFGIIEYNGRKNFDPPGVMIDPYHFTPIETARTDYTGRITNKTDKKVTFLIGNGNCGSYNQDKWYFFDVEPGETGYFVLPYAITEFSLANRYEEHFLNFYTLPSGNMKGDWIKLRSIADSTFHYTCVKKGENLDNDYLYFPFLNEVMKNHSLEIDYYSDDKVEFKFVEAFEYSWED
ncbi:MAG: hypothetical protein K6A89_03515 [Treponema sp.]|nr:hypothetical protein [Treponema sp.]